VKKLCEDPARTGLVVDGVKASLEEARDCLFAPSQKDVLRHVELLSLRNPKVYAQASVLGEERKRYSNSYTDMKHMVPARKKLLVGVLAVVYHCYTDGALVQLAAKGGLMRFIDLL
jgi:hypothetical protein